MLPPELIDKIRDATDIVEVVGQKVVLKKAGANHKGLCPFHQEKTPSFTVNQKKQFYHCFGCGEGGDVFSFIMKTQHKAFYQVVEELAARAGVELPATSEVNREESDRRAREREELLGLLELSAAWFTRNLRESREGEAGLQYLLKRGLTEETIQCFRLGYAPHSGQALIKAAKTKGYKEEQLLNAGLVGREEKGGFYSRFRGRVIFPIENTSGKVVGFGGRLMGEGEPKYLNSPETPVFSKGSLLFAFQQAKEEISRQNRALMVEGYMDAVACHQHGVSNAVATLGTAAGEAHARLLKRYAGEVVLAFDSDRAGLAAGMRACGVLVKASLSVRVLVLKGAKDPDEFLKASGREAFQAQVESAVEAPVFFVDASLALKKADPAKASALPLKERVEILQSLFPLLALYPTEMEVANHLRNSAKRVGLSEEAVLSDFQSFRKSGKALRVEEEAPPARPAASPEKRKAPRGPRQKIEREILALLVEKPELVSQAVAWLPLSQFSDPVFGEAAGLLWQAPGQGILETVTQNPDKAGAQVLEGLWAENPRYGNSVPQEALRDLVRRLQLEALREQKAMLDGILLDKDLEKDGQEARELLAKSQQIAREMDKLKREGA